MVTLVTDFDDILVCTTQNPREISKEEYVEGKASLVKYMPSLEDHPCTFFILLKLRGGLSMRAIGAINAMYKRNILASRVNDDM